MKLFLLFLMFGVSLSSVHGEELSPLISALPATTKPKIDGILDEPCWQTAELSSPMVAIGGAAVKVPAWGNFAGMRSISMSQ